MDGKLSGTAPSRAVLSCWNIPVSTPDPVGGYAGKKMLENPDHEALLEIVTNDQ
jgi:hypothetical protein